MQTKIKSSLLLDLFNDVLPLLLQLSLQFFGKRQTSSGLDIVMQSIEKNLTHILHCIQFFDPISAHLLPKFHFGQRFSFLENQVFNGLAGLHIGVYLNELRIKGSQVRTIYPQIHILVWTNFCI
jgi:hypothetical protein